MVKGEQAVLVLALLYKPGVSSAGDDKDVFMVNTQTNPNCSSRSIIIIVAYDSKLYEK